MKREIKFRAYNHVAKRMYYEEKAGDVFKWQNEAQIQTIMQYTGLTDKNDTEIYEGDVLFRNNYSFMDTIFLVEWDSQKCCFDLPIDTSKSIVANKFEVIGNIFEHPELINS